LVRLELPLLPFTNIGKRFYSSPELNGIKVDELLRIGFSKENFYPWFSGFTDAEGSFFISKVRNKIYSFSFEIKLHIDDVNVLNFLQNTLGIGKVYLSKSSSAFKFVVSKQSEVKKIIEIL